MSFAIVINEKGGQPRRQEFLKGEITIGRVQGNDIVLPKQNVSKRHSRVVLKNGKFVITDLKSTNGTYVNGRKITTPMVIKETDKIYIGDFVLSTELIDGVSEGSSNASSAPPPPPPTSSLPGSRPPFPGGMPSKTIASGMSPFAQQDPASAPMTSVAPPPPMQNDGPASSPFAPPAPPVAPPAPPVAPPAPPVAPPAPPVAPPAPPVAPPAPPVAPPAASSPFGNSAQRMTSDSVQPVVKVDRVIEEPSTSVPKTSSSPFGGTSAPSFPKSPKPSVISKPQSASSPSAMDIDSSVFDGVSENAPLVKIHQALNDGLSAKGLSTPNRYRPGQVLNPELLDAAFEILQPYTAEHSEEVVSKVIDEAFSVGALQPLIEDSSVRELFLNGAHHLVYYRVNQEQSTSVQSPFTSVEQAHRAALRILNGLGQEGAQRAEGRLGEFRVYVDINGAEGPYICLQRSIQTDQISQLASRGLVSQAISDQLPRLIAQGGHLVIASRSTRAQSVITSAIALETLGQHRVVMIGASHHLGNRAGWLSLEGDDSSLKSVERLSPDAVIIRDQSALDGTILFETLSASSRAILMITARDIHGAIAKVRRRSGNDDLALEAVDLIVFVDENNGQPTISDIYSLTQGAQVYSQGNLSGDLV